MQTPSFRLSSCPSLLRVVVVLCLASLLRATSARAEVPEPDALSADQFLARVEKNHPGLPSLAVAVEQANANVVSAGLWTNPALSYDREEIFIGGRGQPENFVRLELPLEVSGRRGLRVEASRRGLEAARATSTRDRAGLLFDALGTYWRTAAARQTVGVLEQEREALVRLISAVRARTAAGDTSGYDLDRLEVEVEQLEDLLAEAQREHDAWRRRLGLLLGAPRDRFEAADTLLLPAAPAAQPEDLLQHVLASRADCKAARLRVSQGEHALTAGGRGWFPDVVLTGGVRNALATTDFAWGYVGGVSLSLPVFDHGQGEVARAEAQRSQATAALRLLEQQVAGELLTAHDTLILSLAQATRFERTQVPRLDRLVRRAEVSFREGERPVFELLDAYRTTRALRLRQVDLRLRARLAELELARTMGLEPGEPK